MADDTAQLMVARAVARAVAAVAADEEGDSKHSYALYAEATRQLDMALGAPDMPQVHKAALTAKADAYRARAAALQTILAAGLDGGVGSSTTNAGSSADSRRGSAAVGAAVVNEYTITFREISEIASLPKPDPAPEDAVRVPYWLMRNLASSIESGGYVTPKVYVPRAVWFQNGAKFTAITSKYESCELLLDFLAKLQEENPEDPEHLCKELDTFCASLTEIQNSLARNLSYIAEIRDESVKKSKFRNAVNIIKKKSSQWGNMASKVEDNTSYINLIQGVCMRSQFIESWLVQYESGEADHDLVLANLRRISDFFFTVFLTFVMKDFNTLLARFVRKSTDDFLS